MEFQEMENYIKKTHNKFFFVFKEDNIKEVEEKIPSNKDCFCTEEFIQRR